MLSGPGALLDLNFLVAASSYSTVKSVDMLASAVAALESEVTSREVHRTKYMSASEKRPLFRSCEAMTLRLLDTWSASCFCLSACLWSATPCDFNV